MCDLWRQELICDWNVKKFRFNTIFWKIFLSYWLVMERRFSLQTKANALVTVYEHGGVRDAVRWLRRRDQGRDGPVYLLNDKFNDLLGKSVPESLKRVLAEGGLVYFENNRPRPVQKVLGQDERIYWVVGLRRAITFIEGSQVSGWHHFSPLEAFPDFWRCW
jgi:hypothetical protein